MFSTKMLMMLLIPIYVMSAGVLVVRQRHLHREFFCIKNGGSMLDA